MIGVVLLFLVGLGVGIYFLMNAKKCEDHETQDDCKEPCQWDTYGGKCIDENGILTPAPTPTPDSDQSGSSGSGGSGGGPTSMSGYANFPNTRVKRGPKLSSDIDACKAKCDADQTCIGISYRDGACYKISNAMEKNYSEGMETSMKIPQGYEVPSIGDRTGTLWGKTVKNLGECAEECKNTALCGGFRYKDKDCQLLHKDGISETTVDTGYQFFKAKTPKTAGPDDYEPFHIGGYSYRASDAPAQCNKYNAQLATREQMENAWEEGANWCSWGHEVGGMSFPINTSLSTGCSTTPRLVTSGPTGVNVKKGVNCYGVKPGEGAPSVYNFNASKWSQFD